ncbi:MAG: LamB/YcsF family protein [Vicinamibacterales bacterium]
MRVDLNADVGESSGTSIVGDDEGLLRSISSASVAAGVHAGDPTVLRQTIRLARELGVAVGAHPGLRDRDGHGRRELSVSTSAVEDLVLYQVAAVAGVAAAEGVSLQHVKLHGALYNMAARDRALASAAVRAIAAFDRELIVFGLAGSALVDAARDAGLVAAGEFFADRGYERDGTLIPRGQEGALLTDPELVVTRAIQMLNDGVVAAADGTPLQIAAETICIHSDTPGAARLARELRDGLERAGITVGAPRAPRGARGAAPSR